MVESEWRSVKGRCEPITTMDGVGTYTLPEDAALTSIAISLKRIADALDALDALTRAGAKQ
jgi:hypothetical protein